MHAVVNWSCFDKSQFCLIPNCHDEQNLEHLLVKYYRNKEIWDLMRMIGFDGGLCINPKAVFHGVFDIHMDDITKEVLWTTICIDITKQIVDNNMHCEQ